MSKQTTIPWTTHTFNGWWGCTAYGPGCLHCYAESFAKRFGRKLWGKGVPRRLLSADHWAEPLAWDRHARANGIRPRVFCGSMKDWADQEVPPGWRARLWDLIRRTDNLDWLLLTKRSEHIAECLPPDWGQGWGHVWLMVSVSNQEEADRRIPHLAAIPAVCHGLSVEPQLAPLTLAAHLAGLQWVICGGESGLPHVARPFDLAWAAALRDECEDAGVAFFMKQTGTRWARAHGYKDHKGEDPREWFPQYRVRQFPAHTTGGRLVNRCEESPTAG